MKFFLDSAKLDEIKYSFEYLGFDGVTTNPRHIQNSGKPFAAILESLAHWVSESNIEGVDRFPISVEINPHLQKHQDMIEQGKTIAALCKNFVIKLPCTEEGLIAQRQLELSGIRTNVTLVFSPSQALLPAKNNALFVSPFVGWKEASGEDCSMYIQDIVTIYNNYNFETEIIVAALRTGKQIAEAAITGAHIVTCGLQVYKDSFTHPFTDYGLDVFTQAWDATKEN